MLNTSAITAVTKSSMKPQSGATTNRHLSERNGEHRRTKVSFGRTIIRELELQQLTKRYISGRSDVEQWINQAHSFSGYRVTLVWRHQIVSQSDSQAVSQQKNLFNKKFLKFHSNLMQRFRVDLKTFLGLAMPNQCCQKVIIWQIS